MRDQHGREHGNQAPTAGAVQRQVVGVGKRTLVASTFAPSTPTTGGPLQHQAAQPNVMPDDGYASSSSPAPAGAVQRQRSRPAAPASGADANQLAHLLASPPQPRLGGDPVVEYLQKLDMPRLLDQLSEAVDCGYALQLEARIAASPRLGAALQAAELARLARVTPAHPALQRAGAALDQVALDQQLEILSWMLHRRGVSVEATSLVEGAIAMRAERGEPGAGGNANPAVASGGEHTLGENVDGAVASVQNTAAGAPAPINPGQWAPPGDQPGGWYIGTAAHTAIAAAYRAAHPGDELFLNNTPISSMLRSLARLAEDPSSPGAASPFVEDELARRPDIVNATRHHIYEIKPGKAQAEAAAKVRMYLSIFEKAGLAVSLGPTGEPGTSGGVPAPAGVFLFESPEPGVITYKYRRGRLVPVPVPVPFGKRQPAGERRWRWELQPLTLEQKQAIVTTTVGGAMLIIMMILLAPVGV